MTHATTSRLLHDLSEDVKLPPFLSLKGRFHAHLTVESSPDRFTELSNFCRDLKIKFTLIDLADFAGRKQTDPMTTSYYSDPNEGAIGRVVEHLIVLTEALEGEGFPVMRAKLEHESLPSVELYNNHQYHEVHVKLKIPSHDYPFAIEQLRIAGREHHFVPSSNPRERAEDFVSQFVNMRIYQGGISDADTTVQNLLERLENMGFVIDEVKRETTIFDTNLQWDRWWL